MDRLIYLLQPGTDKTLGIYGMIEHKDTSDHHLTLCLGDGFDSLCTTITLDIQGIRVLKKLLADAQKLWG